LTKSNKPFDWLVYYISIYLIGRFVLQVPINDDKATGVLIGLSLQSRKEHIVRAVLESLAFSFTLLYNTMLSETETRLSPLLKYHLLLTPYQWCSPWDQNLRLKSPWDQNLRLKAPQGQKIKTWSWSLTWH